jgi:hypothetical protein
MTPLDGMLVHRRLPPQLLLVPIYTPGSREAIHEKQNVTVRDSNREVLTSRYDTKSGTMPLDDNTLLVPECFDQRYGEERTLFTDE